jgi:hypothetical protein
MVLAGDEGWNWFDPTTWPFMAWWMLFVVSVGVVPAVWKWWRKREAESWPTVPGTIDTSQVEEPSGFFRGKNEPKFRAKIFYTYVINGERYNHKYERGVTDEDEGRELIRDLGGRGIEVHVNPRDTSKSFVSDAEIDRIVAERPPDLAPVEPVKRNETLRDLCAVFALPLAMVALAGVLYSLWIHVNAVFGRKVVDQFVFFAMHVACIVLMFPATWLRNGKMYASWKQAVNTNTRWLQSPLYAFGAYAMFNFFYCMQFVPTKGSHGEELPESVIRMFSGHWMLFFFAAFVMLWTSANPESELQSGR